MSDMQQSQINTSGFTKHVAIIQTRTRTATSKYVESGGGVHGTSPSMLRTHCQFGAFLRSTCHACIPRQHMVPLSLQCQSCRQSCSFAYLFFLPWPALVHALQDAMAEFKVQVSAASPTLGGCSPWATPSGCPATPHGTASTMATSTSSATAPKSTSHQAQPSTSAFLWTTILHSTASLATASSW